MRIVECGEKDAPMLAGMNQRLIEDERSGNPMTFSQLTDRMRTFLGSGYRAFLFEEEGRTVGYALVRETDDPPYLRQFYIERDCRRRHYGRRAFQMLLSQLGTDAVDLDVLPWNRAGLAFWRDCGLTETCISMRWRRPE